MSTAPPLADSSGIPLYVRGEGTEDQPGALGLALSAVVIPYSR